jgi:hypothetical protein
LLRFFCNLFHNKTIETMKQSGISLKIAFIILLGLILVNCSKENGNPPVLPPEESMTIDFTTFGSQSKSAEIVSVLPGNNNWVYAATVAGYFSTLLFSTLAVPVYSFQMAIDNTPVYTEDKTWQWSFSATVQGATYKCRLTGQIREKDVLWKMYIGREGTGSYPEFIWFEGTSDLDGTKGQWILNHSYLYQEPLLQIDWILPGTDNGYVKYSYVRSLNDNRVTDPFKTSYFEYGRGKTTGTFNSYFNAHFFNGVVFSDVDAEWNSTSHIGRVKSNAYFGDTNWHCWDSTLQNITCP